MVINISSNTDNNYVNKAGQAIISAGIDIGTTTTQLVISRLIIKNIAPGSSIPRMEITDKEVLHRSKIYFTPLLDHQIIDSEAIASIVADEYRSAGLSPEVIDTGAVIITGETAKKENARNIAESMAGLAGDFVVATAGVNLESVLAGRGSGAAAYSKQEHRITVNADIGGGTSNIAVFRAGRAIDTACINIGGHLIEFEKNGDRITYIAEPARAVLRACGLPWTVGDRVFLADLKKVASAMAVSVVEAITSRDYSELTGELMMTPSLKLDYPLERFMFSGGVADFIYNDFEPVSVSQVTRFGDMGPLLGWAINQAFGSKGLVPVKPGETIRATVIGAGTHSVNISGSTITVNENALPLRNITVVTPFAGEVPEKPNEIANAVYNSVRRVISDGSAENVAIALEGPRIITFQTVQDLAEGIARGMTGFVSRDKPLIVVLSKDCAKVLGQTLQLKIGKVADIVCIDQVEVGEGDYIDIGKPIMAGRVVPVVVKTLVFGNPEG